MHESWRVLLSDDGMDYLIRVTAAWMASARWGTVLELKPAMLILLHHENGTFQLETKNGINVVRYFKQHYQDR